MEFVIKQFNELTLDELYKILKVRTSIFVVEQNCPYQELDDLDQSSYHIYLEEDNQIIAYAFYIFPRYNNIIIRRKHTHNFITPWNNN